MENKKAFLITSAYYLVIAGAVYIVFKYAIFVIMPFLVGFTVAAVLSPLTKWLSGRFGMKRKAASVFVMVLFYATVGILVSVLAVQLILKLGALSRALPTLYKNNIEPAIGGLISAVNDFVGKLSDRTDSEFAQTVSGFLDSAKSSIAGAVSDVSVRLLSRLSSFAASVPQFVIELVFAVISGFFFICDFDGIIAYIKSRLPSRAVGTITDVGEKMMNVGAKYLRSYVLIMLITFAELFFGLSVIGTRRALAWAFIISLLDFLPVIGSGFVMLPWGITELIIGKTFHGIGLIAVWSVVTVIRNIVEPRIVGRQVGLHPLVTLMAMFVGTKLFGFVGLLIFPIAVSIAVPVIRDRRRNSDSGS